MEPSAAFGEVLRHLRKEQRFSQEKLALDCGLERTFISFLERGLRQPSLTTILKLSKVLGVSASEMVARVEMQLDE